MDLKRISKPGLNCEEIVRYFNRNFDAGSSVDEAMLPIINRGIVPRAVRRLKNIVKRTPIGKTILHKNIKKRILERFTDESKLSVDLTPLFALSDLQFLQQSIDVLLGRPMGDGEWALLQAMRLGMPREAVIYVLCISPEMNQNLNVRNFSKYDKAFRTYSMRRKIAGLPVINYIVALFAIPMRLKHAEQNIALNEVNAIRQNEELVRTNAFRINNLSEQLQVRHAAQVEHMEKLYVNQIKKLEELHVLAADQASEIYCRQSEKLDSIWKWGMESTRDKTVISSFPDGVTVVKTDEMILGVPSEDWRLAAWLSWHNHLEPGTEAVLKNLIRPGMTVVDAGANIGVMSIIMARGIGDEGTLYAFEPAKKTYDVLCDNLKINGFEGAENIHIINKALTDGVGEVEFMEYQTSGHNSIYHTSEAPKRIVKGPTINLDAVLNGQKVDVIKIDVEGAEHLVFDGMKRTLVENNDLKIIMEFAPGNLKNANRDPERFLDDLLSLGFKVQIIDEISGQLSSVDKEYLIKSFSTNLLLSRGENA